MSFICVQAHVRVAPNTLCIFKSYTKVTRAHTLALYPKIISLLRDVLRIDLSRGSARRKIEIQQTGGGRRRAFHFFFSLYCAPLPRINQYLILRPRATCFARSNYFVDLSAPHENCARVKLVMRMPLFPHRHSAFAARRGAISISGVKL